MGAPVSWACAASANRYGPSRVCSLPYVRHAVCASGDDQIVALGPPPEHASSSCMSDDIEPASIQRASSSPFAVSSALCWHLKPPISEPTCATPDIDSVIVAV